MNIRILTLAGLAALGVHLSGCKSDMDAMVAELQQVTDSPTAATYKEGRGIALNERAAKFVGLSTAEVAIDEALTGSDFYPAVPEKSLLRTARGTFVFAQNGEWFLRTQVEPGSTADGWTVVTDGLYEGDVVVVDGVDDLWLAEISAVNGGVGCAHGH